MDWAPSLQWLGGLRGGASAVSPPIVHGASTESPGRQAPRAGIGMASARSARHALNHFSWSSPWLSGGSSAKLGGGAEPVFAGEQNSRPRPLTYGLQGRRP